MGRKFSRSKKNTNVKSLGVNNDLRVDPLFDTDYRLAGDSVNNHKKIEKANELLAEEEISQSNNNL
jgi:hypothetical protein